MSKFRKKPVVIEAIQWDRNRLDEFLTFVGGAFETRIPVDSPESVEIITLEGIMRADLGDWIIKGVKGEFYLCKPDIFEATYEPVPSEDVGK